ncbi:MAG: 2-dehydropantoate 2-reductase [Xanthomonadales bacterium]|nr:2-dehydropantoate 2-reductase [Xanthomonadales bacterium]
MIHPLRIGVAGAGSIGAYLGARLAADGHGVILLGRQRLADAVAEQGVRVTDLNGLDEQVQPDSIRVVTEPAGLDGCDIIFVTTKSHDTQAMAESIAPHVTDGATVVSFQNGVRNPDTLRKALPQAQVLAGMVPYNVVWAGPAHFHQGTSGSLVLEQREDAEHLAQTIADACNAAGLPAGLNPRIQAVQWGKLVINLNNATNALSGIPLQQQLADRDYRRVTAAAQREALAMIRGAGLAVRSSGKLLPTLMPTVLDCPDWLFRLVAGGLVKIDPQARSSMWEDLNRGRKTEIDYLNGEILRLAEQIGRPAPVNTAICRLIQQAEADRAPPNLTATALLQKIGVS